MGLTRDKSDKIKGATDNTLIGNVGDKLKVTNQDGPYVVYTSTHLTNGGSFEADVNGSTTQQVFSRSPGAGEVWYLESLTISLVDGGVNGVSNFGALSGLSNGVRWRVTSNGVSHSICVITTNLELQNEFPVNSFSVPIDSGFLNEDDNYRGSMLFRQPIKLDGNQSDTIRMEINDDLSGLERFICRIYYYEINE